MHITLTPMRHDLTLALLRMGDVLVINGCTFDFGQLPDGARIPATAVDCDWLTGDITRNNGRLNLTVILPHGADAESTLLYPADLLLSQDGPVTAPGLTAPDWIAAAPGSIDWAQMVTADQQEVARRMVWRETASIPKLDLLLNLVNAGIISEDSAMSADIPAEFAPIIDEMPNPPRSEIRIRWAHLVNVPRNNPLVLLVQNAFDWTDETVDGLFGWVD